MEKNNSESGLESERVGWGEGRRLMEALSDLNKYE